MKSFILALALVGTALPAHAAIVLTNPVYTQDFNGLAATGTSSVVPDFEFVEAGGNANTTYAAGTGSNNAGNTYSFGTGSLTDRALGGVRSNNLIPLFGAQFTNGLGSTITSVSISFTGELWRLGTINRTDLLSFEYSTDATSLTTGTYLPLTALDFVTPNIAGIVGSRDGNLAANQTFLSGTIAGLSLLQGQSLYIRFVDGDASGADDGLAIDDFRLEAITDAIPEPASWAMLIAGFGLVGGAMRRRRGAAFA